MILVLNCGSQSIKWKVFNEKLKVVQEGRRNVLAQENFQEILAEELNKIDRTKVNLIGHRVVHGGGIFTKSTEITSNNIGQLEKISNLAPLHNPFNVFGIKKCQEVFGGVKNVAVFDTEFFNDLPSYVYTCALPEEIVKECGFRKYGFHGISHEYVASKTKAKKIITVHLGGGCSITAIKNGKAIDTSMGFTPMQGLIMMTRAGDIDSGIVLELVKKYGLDRTNDILNKESGVSGICGEKEMLKVLDKVKAGDKKAKLAFDVFVYSAKKYIGSYFAILGGCDALIFTGSIGSGLKITRNAICKNLDILKNTKIMAVETDEELAIAQKIIKLK